MQSLFLPLFLSLSLSLLVSPAVTEIIQLQVVHRHGARNPLTRTHTPGAGGRVGLLPQGITQLTSLGHYLRSQYILPTSPRRIRNISSTDADTRDVASISSNFPRTLQSSRAFLTGLYPQLLLPTAVFSDQHHDWRIRGYALCTKFHDDIQQWYKSPEFTQKQSELSTFLEPLSEQVGHKDGLQSIVNVYDKFLIVNRAYTSDDPDLADLKQLDSDTLARLKQAADWVETRKFHQDTAGTRVAGGLVAEIIRRAQLRSIQLHPDGRTPPTRPGRPSSATGPSNKLVEYSAHYPTLLSLLAALRGSNRPDELQDTIPDFGAALLIELHHDEGSNGSDDYIKLRWWEGAAVQEPALSVRDIAVGRDGCEDAEMGCSLRELEKMEIGGEMTRGAFCDECEADGPLCVEGRAAGDGGENGDLKDGCGTRDRLVAAGVGVVVGIVSCLVFVIVGWNCRSKRLRRRMEGEADDSFDVAHFEAGGNVGM